METFRVGLILILSLTSSIIAADTDVLLLSPLISRNRTEEARNQSLVDPELFHNVKSHSGFLTVDERTNANLFFWYFPVADKPVNETPWIIWMQGGPGASSLAGLFDEMGPFQYDVKTNQLKLREFSWGKNHSLLFIDNPVGAGFSFGDSYDQNINEVTIHLYNAVQQFLMIFPELRKAPLYIAGESYAGHYVPALAIKILHPDSNSPQFNVNLEGIMLGNPVLNRESIADYTQVFYHWGLIDSQGVLAARDLQDAYTSAIESGNAKHAHDLREELLDKLEDLTAQKQMYNILKDELILDGFNQYLNTEEVRRALHVGNVTFKFSNPSVNTALVKDFLSPVRPLVEELLEHYRVLIYCGQLDLMAPCVPNAEARRKNWQWSKRDKFLSTPRTPWWYNETIAGYAKAGGNLTEVLVRGAGHLVPMDKPAEALNLITVFIKNLALPMPPNYEVPIIPDYTEPKAIPNSNNTGTGTKTVMIVSVIINVLLVIGIVFGVFYFIRWKNRNDGYFYTSTEDNISDGILTMT